MANPTSGHGTVGDASDPDGIAPVRSFQADFGADGEAARAPSLEGVGRSSAPQWRLMENERATGVPMKSTRDLDAGWNSRAMVAIVDGTTIRRGGPVLRDLKANSFFTMLRT